MAVFLGEDGVLSMGNKTPITILQETLQKKGITPHYELIHNGTGTLDPVFKYEVSAMGFCAIGDGKTKKAAKHDAAAALLKRMQTGSSMMEKAEEKVVDEVDVASPYACAIKENLVGMLDDICFVNKIPNPIFEQVSEEGPPHARIFTMKCIVGPVSESAVARTKKQAKHLAAQRMISKVGKILGSRFQSYAEKSLESEDVGDVQIDYNTLEMGSMKEDLTIPFSEYPNVFFYRAEEENCLPEMFLNLKDQPEEFYEKMENSREFLESLMEALRVPLEIVSKSVPAPVLSESDEPKETEILAKYANRFKDVIGKLEEEVSLYKDPLDFDLEELDLPDTCHETSPLPNSLECLKLVDRLEELKARNMDELNHSAELTVETLVGRWTVIGLGVSKEEAIHDVVVEALKLFRMLSFPPCDKGCPVGNKVE